MGINRTLLNTLAAHFLSRSHRAARWLPSSPHPHMNSVIASSPQRFPCRGDSMVAGVVGALNMMGESYNFLEFVDAQRQDEAKEQPESWMDLYGRVVASFKALKSADVMREAERIGFHLDLALRHEYFYEECDEQFLERDNKMSPTKRTNLIVCGAKPIDDINTPLFLHAQSW
eukprot:762462-Hanusia_phi.AAC.9